MRGTSHYRAGRRGGRHVRTLKLSAHAKAGNAGVIDKDGTRAGVDGAGGASGGDDGPNDGGQVGCVGPRRAEFRERRPLLESRRSGPVENPAGEWHRRKRRRRTGECCGARTACRSWQRGLRRHRSRGRAGHRAGNGDRCNLRFLDVPGHVAGVLAHALGRAPGGVAAGEALTAAVRGHGVDDGGDNHAPVPAAASIPDAGRRMANAWTVSA